MNHQIPKPPKVMSWSSPMPMYPKYIRWMPKMPIKKHRARATTWLPPLSGEFGTSGRGAFSNPLLYIFGACVFNTDCGTSISNWTGGFCLACPTSVFVLKSLSVRTGEGWCVMVSKSRSMLLSIGVASIFSEAMLAISNFCEVDWVRWAFCFLVPMKNPLVYFLFWMKLLVITLFCVAHEANNKRDKVIMKRCWSFFMGLDFKACWLISDQKVTRFWKDLVLLYHLNVFREYRSIRKGLSPPETTNSLRVANP